MWYLNLTTHSVVVSPFPCRRTPSHGVLKAFVWDSHCILRPWYHLQWWAVKKNYSQPVVWKTTWSNTWPVKTNGLCHWDMFFLITSQVYYGWLIAKAWMRTKSCSTISTPSSCSIDLPVGHGPPPRPSLRTTMPQDCTWQLISPSQRGALTNQLPASCWLVVLEATTGLWFGA